MPKSKAQKKEIINELSDKVAKAKSVIFTKFTGLGVKDNESIRKELKTNDGEYYVAKKTLFDLAFKDSKILGLDIRGFEGQVAAVFGFGDEIAPAKVIAKYKKSLEGKVEFIGGILEGKFIDAAGVTVLSNLPSKQELLAKLVGSINAPVSGFVNVLAGNLRSFVNVLNAVKDNKV